MFFQRQPYVTHKQRKYVTQWLKTWRNFFQSSNAKIPDFPWMKFTPLAKGQSLNYATSSNFQLRQTSKKQTSKNRERSLCITRNIPQQNKMVKPQSGFSTPPIKEEKYFVRFVLTILWCHSLLWSITVKSIQHCRRCPFYTITSKSTKLFLVKSDCDRLISISHESTQVINCNYLVKLRMVLFLTSINYKHCKLQTLTTSRWWYYFWHHC